jgi:DNA polymerase III alpha subunit
MYNTWKVENGYLVYSCGCKFEVIKERDGHFPLVKPGNPFKNWNYECEATKMLLADGNTVGVFQLESGSGRHWTKRLKPENTAHMAALAAILRPSCIEAYNEDGINTTELYCRFKNGEEIAAPLVSEIGYLLEDNYYQMLYQEDAMKVARDMAGFDGNQCNTLIKGIGKKKADIIAGIKKEFLDGCAKVGILNEERAKLVFENIEVSQRYGFNKSHAVCYGTTALITAFAKVHFPEYFYESYLEGASEKQKPLEERHKIIKDAKFFDIKVTKPEISTSKSWFYSPKTKSILFGLTSVKGVGRAIVKKVKKFYKDNDDHWLKTLIRCLYMVNSRAAENIIKAGIIDNGMTRTRQLHELKSLYGLTKGQVQFLVEHCEKYTTLVELLKAMNKTKKEGGGLHKASDKIKVDGVISILENPGYSMDDKPEWIASVEEEVLGIGITATLLDATDTRAANTTCKELLCGKNSKGMMIACQVDKVEQKEIKKGKNTGKPFLKIDFSDNSGTISGVMVWPETYEKCGYLIKENNTLLMQLYRNNKEDLVISNVFQI